MWEGRREGRRAGAGGFALSDPPLPSSVTGFEQVIKKREGIVCLRGQGSGYDLFSKQQCSVLQPDCPDGLRPVLQLGCSAD